MRCRVPVIAANSGGPKETVVNGETGFLRESNPGEFASAAIQLLRSDNLCRQMGERAFEHVEKNFSERVFTDKFLEVMNKVDAKSFDKQLVVLVGILCLVFCFFRVFW